jgi:hypothetical protein
MHTPSRCAGRRPRLSALLATLAVVLLSESSGAAGESAEPIRLDYRASADCPNEAEFVARLRARTSHVRPAWPGEAARTFAVVAEAGPPSTGHLRVGESVDGGGMRAVQADSCSRVVDALALMVALAVDPSALIAAPTGTPEAGQPAASRGATPDAPSLTPAPDEGSLARPISASPDERSGAPPVVPAPAPPPAPIPTAARSAEGEALRHERPPERVSAPAARSLAPASGQGHIATGFDFAVSTGVAPRALLGASPFVGYATGRGGWIDPTFRLGFLRAWSGLFDVGSAGRAVITWTVARADACPIALPALPLHLTGCLRVEAGVLEAAGADIPSSRTASRAWLAAGPTLRAEVPIVGPLFADAEGSVLFRLTEDRFYFRPDFTVYRVPLTGFGAGAGLEVRFL